MALIILGRPCRICSQPLKQEDHITGFSHFVRNMVDPLYFFTDAAFHTACLETHPLYERAMAAQTAVIEHYERMVASPTEPGKKISMEEADNLLNLGYLTDDPENPLFAFNFLGFDKRTFSEWVDLPAFIAVLKAEMAAGRWSEMGGGNYYFIDFLENALINGI